MHNATSVATTKRLDYYVPDIEFDVAYSSGLWSNDSMLSPSCSTGNCTWAKFQSSGICSQCSDITKSMELKCEKIANVSVSTNLDPDFILQDVTVTCHLAPPQGNPTQFDLGFLFRSSISAFSSSWLSYNTKGVSWHVFSAYLDFIDHGDFNETLTHPSNQSFTWPGNPLMVVAYAEIGYNKDYLESDFIGGIRVDKVTECSLELCLLEYEVSVQDGTPDVITSALDYGQLFWRNK
ncbi:unnamed protein product [Penicillium salamii]|nr:unnamed protein product [Penicillium salamii]